MLMTLIFHVDCGHLDVNHVPRGKKCKCKVASKCLSNTHMKAVSIEEIKDTRTIGMFEAAAHCLPYRKPSPMYRFYVLKMSSVSLTQEELDITSRKNVLEPGGLLNLSKN